VHGTREVVEAAGRAKVSRFVQLSSVAVYGRPERGRVTERWPTRKSGSPYDDTKTEAERLAFARGRELGIAVSAVRPPLIYGPYDKNFIPRALRLFEKGTFLLIDGGHALINLVSVDHVVDVLLLAAQRSEAAGEAFNVSDAVADMPPSVREAMTVIAEAAHTTARFRSIPRPVAMAAAHVVDRAWRFANAKDPPPITPFVVQALTNRALFDSKKAVERLGWEPHTDPLIGLHKATEAIMLRSP
jgi:nucleoside-diphosphate-sugar epimerase